MSETSSEIGLIGLAVMGQNLALNIADHGFRISVYNRTTSKMEAFVAENPNTPGGLEGHKTLEAFVASLKRPRKIIILVQAGWATDKVIEGLAPLLEKDDIIIDGGNAKWDDTIRREKELAEKGLNFIGSGVSGGEEGARFGPSLMPGGSREAWQHLEPIWKAIAAKVDPKTGKPIETFHVVPVAVDSLWYLTSNIRRGSSQSRLHRSCVSGLPLSVWRRCLCSRNYRICLKWQTATE